MKRICAQTLLMLVCSTVIRQVQSQCLRFVGFTGALSTLEHQVSGTVSVTTDSNGGCEVRLSMFTYDGAAPAAYFWCSASDSTSDQRAGFRANPDRLKRYYNGFQDVTVALVSNADLSGNCRVFGVWCEDFNADFGHVTFVEPTATAAPPPPANGVPASPTYCRDLFPGSFNIMWQMVNTSSPTPSLTVTLAAYNLPPNYWMSFGFAPPNATYSSMVGSDVVIAGVLPSGDAFALDHFITARSQCNYQAGQSSGVCPDSGLAGSPSADSSRLQTAMRGENITSVTFTRPVAASDAFDYPWTSAAKPAFAVFAFGPLGETSTTALPIVLYHGSSNHAPRQFNFTFGVSSACSMPLGPVGAETPFPPPATPRQPVQTLSGVTDFVVTTAPNPNYPNPPGWGISYHLNGAESPVLLLKRGTTYTFTIKGGLTHPFYITSDVIGGNSNASEIVFAGGNFSSGTELQPYVLTWTPNATHPALLYYQCYTHEKLGWQIELLSADSPNAAGALHLPRALVLLGLAGVLAAIILA